MASSQSLSSLSPAGQTVRESASPVSQRAQHWPPGHYGDYLVRSVHEPISLKMRPEAIGGDHGTLLMGICRKYDLTRLDYCSALQRRSTRTRNILPFKEPVYATCTVNKSGNCSMVVMARFYGDRPYSPHVPEGVALKLGYHNKRNFRAYLNREIQLMAELDHENVVKVLGYKISENDLIIPWLIMPMALYSLGDVNGRLPVCQTLAAIQGLYEGLAYLHELSICHKDIKKDNCLISHKGILQICDFGFAQKTLDKDGYRDIYMSKHREGTPFYLPPEAQYSRSSGLYYYYLAGDTYSAALVTGFMGRLIEGNMSLPAYSIAGDPAPNWHLPDTYLRICPVLNKAVEQGLSITGFSLDEWFDKGSLDQIPVDQLMPGTRDDLPSEILGLCIALAIRRAPRERPPAKKMAEYISQLSKRMTQLPESIPECVHDFITD